MNTKRSVMMTLLIGSVIALALTGCSPAAATNSGEARTLVSVSGFGEASGAPDMVSIQLGIQEVSTDVGEAVAAVNAVTEEIKAAALALGVSDADVQTTNYSVWPDERYDAESGLPTGERVYRVESTLRITMRDVSVLGDVIEQGLDAGANNVYGIDFGLQDTSSLQAEARSEAVTDARGRAEQLAAEMGLSLGEVVSVNEGVAGGVYAGDFVEMAAGMGGGAPISAGELQISVQVQIVFALEP